MPVFLPGRFDGVDTKLIEAGLQAELLPLLIQRMRAALWILLVALTLFALQSWSVYPDRLAPLAAVKGLQMATIAWAFWVLGRRPSWRAASAVALVVIAEVCVTTVASSVVAGEAHSAVVLFCILTMGSAMVLPWGIWPQAAAVGIAAAAIVVNVVLVGATLAALLGPLVAFALAGLTSVYAAAAFQRYRLAERAAREELRTSEARQRAILDAALDCIVTIDDSGRILEFNPAAERTFGLPAAAALGRSLADTIIPPALRDAHRRGLARYVTTGEAAMIGRRIETTACRADGSELPVELTITRIAHDGPPLFTGFLRDLTERNLAREAQVSASLVRAGREMMALLDTDLILERLCSLTTELLGCDCSHSFIWEPGADTFAARAGHGDGADGAAARRALAVPRDAIAGLLAEVQRSEVAQVVMSADLASELPLHEGISTVLYMALGRGEEIAGIHTAAYHGRGEFSAQQQTIARGLAQIASMALTNARLVEELAAADRIKSEFLSTMSHELRTPLNVVLGYAEMLEDAERSERSELVSSIKVAGGHLLEQIDMMLEIGRIEAGRDAPRLALLWLPAFWQEMAQECERLPRHPGVCFEWDGAVPDVHLLADRRKLAAVLRNLLGNAVKFTEHGRVRVAAQRDGDDVVVRVADTGIGIRPEHHALVFEMFRQVDGSDARRHGGAGLGLYIVRRFVEQLGGRVALHSAPGEGSVFSVALPVVASQPDADGARVEVAPAAGMAGC